MPIGDPMGDKQAYVERGEVRRVWFVSVPVRDLGRAIDFYVDVLGLQLMVDDRGRNWVEVGTEDPMAKIRLYVPGKTDWRQPGGSSGIILEVDSIFEFHRKLVDDEVPFVQKPERRQFGGIMATFLDPDGNEISAIEDPDHYQRFPRPARKPKERCPEGDRSCHLR